MDSLRLRLELEQYFVGDDVVLTKQKNEELVQAASVEELQACVKNCSKCSLSEMRTNVVFGDGDLNADLMFVGEAPGRDEDLSGKPFVGRAGQLLTKMIQAMGLERNDVFIANILKCRPPENRNPSPYEIEQCSPYLKQQIAFVKPKVICALGTFAAQTLLNTDERISLLRGQVHQYEGVPLIATFHPAYLLRNQTQKKAAWDDLQVVMGYLNS